LEANAALRRLVRRDDGRTYREMLTQMAKESGIETPRVSSLGSADRQQHPVADRVRSVSAQETCLSKFPV
jgi:hypothetical protein